MDTTSIFYTVYDTIRLLFATSKVAPCWSLERHFHIVFISQNQSLTLDINPSNYCKGRFPPAQTCPMTYVQCNNFTKSRMCWTEEDVSCRKIESAHYKKLPCTGFIALPPSFKWQALLQTRSHQNVTTGWKCNKSCTWELLLVCRLYFFGLQYNNLPVILSGLDKTFLVSIIQTENQ